jgi:cytochrome P450
MDLMGQLVRSSREVLEDKSGNTANASKTTSLTRDEIRGNAFIMFVAGHETTANAIHFSLLELAAKPASQRRLQQELADMLGDTDPSTWDFESSVKPMMGGMMGACMNETLRLFPPVLHIPKVVTSKGSQPLKVNGKACVLPPGTRISLDAGAVHRNPRYWKVKDSLVHPGRDDTEDYIPERWIVTEEDRENRGSSNSDCSGSDEDDYDGNRDLTFGSKLFRPERGAYFPFSDGPRACLGRRIAQVEVLAALAAVFSKYSLELAVDAWASDEEVDKMSREEKVELYRKAQLECFAKLRTSSTLITLKMRGDSVPVRLVERGQERFLNLIDAEQDA